MTDKTDKADSCSSMACWRGPASAEEMKIKGAISSPPKIRPWGQHCSSVRRARARKCGGGRGGRPGGRGGSAIKGPLLILLDFSAAFTGFFSTMPVLCVATRPFEDVVNFSAFSGCVNHLR